MRENIEHLLARNQVWAKKMTDSDPNFLLTYLNDKNLNIYGSAVVELRRLLMAVNRV
jgi:hypothetical protein